MSTIKKYSVSPVTEEKSLMYLKHTLKTNDKKEATERAKFLLKSGFEVNFNVDTYKDGVCIKNEFGYYKNGKVDVYSTTDYRPKKTKKVDLTVTENTISMFFSDEIVTNWKKGR